MILKRFVSDVFAENCYLIAHESHRQAVVVDPGAGVAGTVAQALEDHELELAAVLLTHGHPDHVWDAAAVAGERPVYVAEPDAYRLEDPLVHPSPLTPVLRQLLPLPFERPADVRHLPQELLVGGGAELVPGVGIRALAAPGHTEGSTIYFLAGEWDPEVIEMATAGAPASHAPTTTDADPVTDAPATDGAPATDAVPTADATPTTPAGLVLTGDVLFQGSVGRTDLPGGDPEVMEWTLRTLRQVIDPASMLFPGHGPATTMGRELASNPFLAR